MRQDSKQGQDPKILLAHGDRIDDGSDPRGWGCAERCGWFSVPALGLGLPRPLPTSPHAEVSTAPNHPTLPVSPH